MTHRELVDVVENTKNECFFCTKNSKDCSVCMWRHK